MTRVITGLSIAVLCLFLAAGNNKQNVTLNRGAREFQPEVLQLLNAAKNQPDDPQEVPRLEAEIAGYQANIEKIKSE